MTSISLGEHPLISLWIQNCVDMSGFKKIEHDCTRKALIEHACNIIQAKGIEDEESSAINKKG